MNARVSAVRFALDDRSAGDSRPWLLAGARCEGQESIEAKYLANVRQVTEGYVKAGEGYFSPDMATIVYQAIRPEYPFYQIYTQPLAGGTPRLISTGRGRTTCAYFSPDGQTDPVCLESPESESRCRGGPGTMHSRNRTASRARASGTVGISIRSWTFTCAISRATIARGSRPSTVMMRRERTRGTENSSRTATSKNRRPPRPTRCPRRRAIRISM